MNIWTKRIVAVAAWSAVSSSAMAGTVFCPETNSAELVRTISVISDSANDSGFADCFAYGTGNIPSSGDVQFDIPPPAQPSYEVLFSRDQTTVYNWLDTFNVGTGNTNGLISWADNVITISDLFAGYTNLLVLVKVGGGTGDPDWATFVGGNALSGSPYAGHSILFFSVQTGSAWAAGFTGQLDGFRIELTDGSVANVNFEASNMIATDKDACKKNGWMTLYRADFSTFKNQGDCIQYVNTGK